MIRGLKSFAHHLEKEISKREDEIARLKSALAAIAFASGDQPAALGIPEADWYRRRFYDCVATAAGALDRANLGRNLGRNDENKNPSD